MGNMKTIIPVVSLMISILAFSGTLFIYAITRRRENYQNLLQRISSYSIPEMHTAVSRLRNLYRDNGDPAFIDKYIKIMKTEKTKFKSIRLADQMEYQLTTLHYQRKIVSSFYRGLAILLKNGLIQKKATFQYWTRDDVDIVVKIIIPIENRLGADLHLSGLNPKTDLLYYIAKLRNRFLDNVDTVLFMKQI